MSDPITIRSTAREVLTRLLEEKTSDRRGQKIVYGEFFPVDLKHIVRIIGWKLRPLEAYDQRAKSDFGQKIIFLNMTDTTPGEQNFSLAHEIGHALLHERIVECYGGSLNRPLRSVRRGLREPVPLKMADLESEADQFAAELLMPAKPVRQHFRHVFSVDSLSVSSPEATRLAQRGSGAPPYQVALELAGYYPRTCKSMIDQFGTSKAAMARQMVRLRLVHT